MRACITAANMIHESCVYSLAAYSVKNNPPRGERGNSQRDFAVPQRDHTTGHVYVFIHVNREPEPARPADLVALQYFHVEWERLALRNEPAAEIGARRARARVLDEAGVLGKEKARTYRH